MRHPHRFGHQWGVLVVALSLCSACSLPEEPTTPRSSAVDTGWPRLLVRRPPEAVGPVEGDQIGRAVALRGGALEGCYDAAGGEALGAGVVYALVDVSGFGDVEGITLGHTDLRSARFESCVEAELARVDFPPPASRRPTTAQVYLVFGAGSEDGGRALLSLYRQARRDAEARAHQEQPASMSSLRTTVQSCYERVLRSRPTLRGRTVLSLTFDEEGTVAEAAMSDDELGGALGQCLLSAVRNLRLEQEDPGPVTLHYPVILEPGR